MTNFRKLCSAIALTLVLALSAMSGETSGPPGCTDPGEMNSPPCTNPGETSTPPGFTANGETQGPSLTLAEGIESAALDVLMFGIQNILAGA